MVSVPLSVPLVLPSRRASLQVPSMLTVECPGLRTRVQKLRLLWLSGSRLVSMISPCRVDETDIGGACSWGVNADGQLGLEDTLDRGDGLTGALGDALPAVNLGAQRTAKAVAAGMRHTCALLDDHAVKWYARSASPDSVSRWCARSRCEACHVPTCLMSVGAN